MFDYSGVATLIMEQFGPTFIEVVRRETVFLDLMTPKQRAMNEKNIQWKANYAGNSSAGSYAENANFGSAGEQSYDTALLTWALNKVVIQVSGLAQAVSEGKNSVINALTTETEQALRDLKRNINLQTLADGDGNLNGVNPGLNATGLDITGIQAAIDDGSQVTTYANIDRTAKLWWRSYVLANATIPRPITESLMMQVTNELETRGGKVTHIMCSPNTWTAYGNLLKAERRQVNPGTKLEGGWATLDFNGIPVVKVPSYQERRMDFIDMDLVDFPILVDFSVEGRDPGHTDATVFFVKHYSQFLYENPWLAGSIRDIATT